MKVYRGAPSAARNYVEADRSRVDDYYLAEGSGLARRFTASPAEGVRDLGSLDGDAYERWVAGCDPDTGVARGRLRTDGNAVRFVEVTVNGPKTWSLAAALDPEVAEAYDAAQDRAAAQIIGWVAEHATTRVGPRGRQVQVPVEHVEGITVRHYTSRAGDPHRHLHLQVNARVFAAGKWRGLHTVGFRDSIEALNGIGHAAMMTDPAFRGALAAAGFTLDPATGEIPELTPFVGAFSERAAQIARNIDSYEAEWRTTNPGQEPGPAVRRSWDRRAWKQARPDKVAPLDGAAMVEHWTQQLHELGYRDPTPQPGLPLVVGAPRVADLDRDAVVASIVSRLGARRSAWNPADIRGQAEKAIAAAGLVLDPAVRTELAEDLTARTVRACVPLLDQAGVPEHVRSLTSVHVLEVEADIVTRLAARTQTHAEPAALSADHAAGLDDAQRAVVAALAGAAGLVVVEGAAGAGKTTTLAAAQQVLAEQGRRMLVVTPTLKAAQVAAREVGAATSVAWLVHQHGYRWDADGRWTREPAHPGLGATLGAGDLLLVDEAGMLDQDTAHALLTVAEEMGARLALVGDRHQLPAIGRGGVLDLAAGWTPPDAHVELDVAHRFTDPTYAAISLALRTGTPTYTHPAHLGECERVGEVWEALVARGQIRIYPSEAERTHAIARLAADQHTTAGRSPEMLVMADTREQAAALNGAIRDRLHHTRPRPGGDGPSLVTGPGERLGVGDRVATRRNDRTLGVSNRDTWTITAIDSDGSLTLQGRRSTDLRTVPAGYAREHVELAYATTIYGAQGETTRVGHLMLGEHTTAASAYVAMTRGREDNVAHLVAEDLDHARDQWEEVFARDRADLGPTHAATLAATDIERYGTQPPLRPLDEVLADLWAAWTNQADLTDRHQELAGDLEKLQQVAAIRARYAPDRDRLHAALGDSMRRWRQADQRVADLEATLKTETTNLRERVWDAWRDELHQAHRAAGVVRHGAGRLGQRRRQVRDAAADLAAFGNRWRPVHPDLATDPTELAGQLRRQHWPHDGDAIDTYVAAQVARAHPDADQIRAAKHDADRGFQHAEQSLNDLETTMWTELAPYRWAAQVDNVTELAWVTDRLAGTQHQLHGATAHVQGLHREPALRALPGPALDHEREHWAADRTATQEAADREARKRLQRQLKAETRRPIEPATPSRNTPDRGWGIGR